MDEMLTDAKIHEFIERVADQRPDNGVSPGEIVKRASYTIGPGLRVRELTYTALRMCIDGKLTDVSDVSFWITAAVAVSKECGGFAKTWLDAFNECFFASLRSVGELPSPYGMTLQDDVAACFGRMLQAAVAFAESKEKVGKVLLKKCFAFRAVKCWSENAGWIRSGFTEADRCLLRQIAAVRQIADTNAVVGDSPRVDTSTKQDASMRQGRDDSRNVSRKLEEEKRNRKALEDKLAECQEQLKKKSDALEGVEADLVNRDKRIKTLEDTVANARAEAAREIEEIRGKYEEAQRRAARAENEARTRADNIADVASPIRQQVENAPNPRATPGMADVLLTHIRRLLDVLRENGIEV